MKFIFEALNNVINIKLLKKKTIENINILKRYLRNLIRVFVRFRASLNINDSNA